MASPKILVFALFRASDGTPFTGQTPTFSNYTDETGSAVTPPAISEIGGGLYKFTPVFPTDHGIAFVIDAGASAASRYVYGYLRPEDYYLDKILDLQDEVLGKWEVVTSGLDANRLVLYRQDGTTVLVKFDLTDNSGSPTTTAPYKRTPV